MKRSSQFSGTHAIATLTLALLSLSQSIAAVFTSDTTITPSNATYEGADIVVSNATLTVDGPHTFANLLVGLGGIVTHSFSAGGTITTNIPVADEPQILVGTNEVVLANQNIVAGTVTVKDMSGTISYQINSDFIVSVGGSDTFLRRSEPSAIPDGSMVLVSYEIPGGTISAGLSLTVTGNVEVAAGGFIAANGRGFGGNSGTGNGGETGNTLTGAGAGHGGYGGLSTSNAPGGNVYGAFDQPITLGSGGGQGVGGVGGNGGGAIRLIVSGVVKVDGAITVNGLNATNGRSGGGSGGSIWINAQSVSGTGAITAHGGNGEPIHGGGGGGGRIALYGTNNFTGLLAAYGGLGWKAGGAGTIYTKPTGTGLLLVDNGGRAGTNTATTLSGTPDVIIRGGAGVFSSSAWTARDVLVASNSTLVAFAANTALTLTARSLTVEPTAVVQADGKGSIITGTGAAGIYSGGGHGGSGGNSMTNGFGGYTTDGGNTQLLPATMGRNGGGTNTSFAGGLGGGAIRLIISNDLMLNGRISSLGLDSVPAGGGSGGSIWIDTATITGSGVISVNGGNGNFTLGGGGGGGRIAVYVTTTNQFIGSITAYGGGGANRGGAGTIFLQIMGAAGPLSQEFILDNGGFTAPNARSNTLINPFSSAPVLTVRNGAAGQIASTMTLPSVMVKSNSSLVVSAALTVTSNVVVEATAAIHADGVGANFSGSGFGTQVIQGIYYSGGGGHGGYGGLGGVSAARGGNMLSSSVTSPTFAGGQGGGTGSTFAPLGGMGGGALRMTVNGSLTNNGRISSDGKMGTGTYAGGGAGGSVWLTIGKLYGNGLISANGGPGILPGGGGGGGGRISVGCTSNFFGGNFTAYGGSGTNYGGAGTIYLSTNQPGGLFSGLFVDNGGNVATNTAMSETSFNGDITVSGRATLIISLPGTGPRNVLIKTNSTLLTPVSQSQQFLTLSGNMTIDAGGLFSLEGRGYAAGGGAGAGNTSATPKGGAGHGGYGALNSTMGSAYGSITLPNTAGSGGGSGSGTSLSPLGGAGGGALRLQFTGNNPVLTVNGRLSADGLGGELNSGGGSGGSLQITSGTLAGSGIISANGGAGNGTAGGGGGGRIAITYTTNLFTGQLIASGGSGAVAGGAGTIYTKRNSETFGSVLINNGSLSGTNTPLSSSFSLPTSPFNLTISGGASVFALTQLPQLSNLVINTSSVLTMSSSTTNVFLNVLRNATIASGSAINVDGRGYARSSGNSPGASLANKGAGGGHGGAGGNSQSGALGGTNYGSITQPTLRGSGGGAGANTYVSGCEGGGAIRITAGGTLTVDGYLGANGNPGIQDDSGGGAGGSIWITAGALTGGGNIFAEGGDGDLFGGGGGAGGRIAIYAPSNTFNGFMSVDGGIGHTDGQDGTIFMTTNLSLVEIISGRVTNVFGQGVAGVAVEFLSPQNGIPVTSITDSNGDYSVFVPSSLSGTLTPSFGTNVFFPALLNFNTITTSFTGQNFLMAATIVPTLAMQQVGTNLVFNWNGLPTLVYSLERSTNLVDWVFSSGNFYGAGSHQVIVPIDAEPAAFFRVRGFY